ncbi:MAG: 23S rRNA (pseudouridine(1915)-N(3))-methyltransferase RlmH, partial [Bacilli bacterium]
TSTAIIQDGEEIEKHIEDKAYIITLELDGKSLDSLTFAKVIDNTFSHYASITFVIGGSDGLSNKTKDRANMALSFSSMTFPHQLFRVMLLEQIYRSYKINNNETYHK